MDINALGHALVASIHAHPFAYVYGLIAVNVFGYGYVVIGTIRRVRSAR